MHSTAVPPALCVDSISAVEAFHISDSHMVTSHADGPLEMSGRRVGGKGECTLEVTGPTRNDREEA